MSQGDDRTYEEIFGPCERGPNYSWEIEVRHLQDEVKRLRTLLHKVDSQGERDAWERDRYKKALEEMVQMSEEGFPSNYFCAGVAREVLDKKD